jgi:hypothetical protein
MRDDLAMRSFALFLVRAGVVGHAVHAVRIVSERSSGASARGYTMESFSDSRMPQMRDAHLA